MARPGGTHLAPGASTPLEPSPGAVPRCTTGSHGAQPQEASAECDELTAPAAPAAPAAPTAPTAPTENFADPDPCPASSPGGHGSGRHGAGGRGPGEQRRPRPTREHRGPRVTAWARSCHPLPTLAVTAATAGLAAGHGHSASGTAAVTAAVFTGQLSVGWLNDLIDADRDTAAGRCDKPIAAGQLAPGAVRRAVLLSALSAATLSLYGGWLAASVHALALCSAWGYNLGLKATRWSALTYAVSFGLLPAFIVLALPGTPWPPLWLPTTAALLGCAAHFLNVLPDLADDDTAGVRGLPQRLGGPTSSGCAAALALGACAVLVLGPPGAPAVILPLAAVTLGAGILRGRRSGSRAAFHAVLLVALLNVALLLTAG